jgi:hypothetical protein
MGPPALAVPNAVTQGVGSASPARRASRSGSPRADYFHSPLSARCNAEPGPTPYALTGGRDDTSIPRAAVGPKADDLVANIDAIPKSIRICPRLKAKRRCLMRRPETGGDHQTHENRNQARGHPIIAQHRAPTQDPASRSSAQAAY